MKTSTALKFLVSILPPLVLGAVAGFITAKAIPTWYVTLNRPAISPPNWLFGPVWSTLYVLMGFSLFMILRLPDSRERTFALRIYIVQLLLNFLWSFLFFYFKNIGLALIEIIVLWICILKMILVFRKLNQLSAYLNLPYLCWVTFAVVLNAAYYMLNY
jgi:benzodiazapine receptor